MLTKTEKHSNDFRHQKSFTRKACPEFYYHLIADKFSLTFPLCITNIERLIQTSLLLFLSVLECLVPLSNKLIQLLLHLISSSSFPLQWKKAEIFPILKAGNSEEPANTRPISLLPILSKICERAAHSQLVNFLDSNNIIHQMQSGNRKFHSTESSLLYFTDELLKNMDQDICYCSLGYVQSF